MREHDVQHRAREVRGEARDALDLRAHEVVAERDLAEQLAVVGEVDRERVAARRPRSCRCRGSARRSPRRRGRRRGTSADTRSRPGPPTASAPAARAGRPGGRTSPPAPCGTAATPRRPRRTARRAAARRCGLRTVSIRLPQVGLHLVDARRRARPSGRRGGTRRPRRRAADCTDELGAVALGDLEPAARRAPPCRAAASSCRSRAPSQATPSSMPVQSHSVSFR